MSYFPDNPRKTLWWRAGFGLVVDKIRQSLPRNHRTKQDLDKKQYLLKWRLGYNLYRSCEYEAAIEEISALLKTFEALEIEKRYKTTGFDAHILSSMHITLGRCGIHLFRTNGNHNHLELAHGEYQLAVDSFTADLFTMFRLPILLYEFAQILELYGAYESALEAYSKILTNFPNYRGYFNTLYRTGLLALHLIELSSLNESSVGAQSRDESIDKCVDIFQFLLEALPHNIIDVHIIFLYARAFELSTSAQMRFRSHGVYASLYEACKRRGLANTTAYEAKLWVTEPNSWYLLGSYFDSLDCGESSLASFAYAKYEECAKRKCPLGKDLTAVVTLPESLHLSKYYLKHRRYEMALRYAEIALKLDRYDKSVRDLVKQLTAMAPQAKQRADELSKEVRACQTIISTWKGRCWTPGFRRRLKDSVLADLSNKYNQNRFDMEARQGLAYYARSQYRPTFIFEVHCAIRVQRWYREARKRWTWQEAQRRHYHTLANDALYKFNRRPLSPSARDDIRRLTSHRLLSSKHPIHNALIQIEKDEKATISIAKFFKFCKLLNELKRRAKIREERRYVLFSVFIVVIQTKTRMLLARNKALRLREAKQRKHDAALKIQHFWRRILRSFRYNAMRLTKGTVRTRYRAMQILRRRFRPLLLENLKMKRMRLLDGERRQKRFITRGKRLQEGQELVLAALRIQRFYRHCISNFWMKVSRAVIKRRREAGYSNQAPTLHLLDEKNHHTNYKNPGLDPRQPSFQLFACQEMVVTPKRCGVVELQLLGLVLAHPTCIIKHLVIHDCVIFAEPGQTIPAIVEVLPPRTAGGSSSSSAQQQQRRKSTQPSQQAMDPKALQEALGGFFKALTKCRSLQSLCVLGGTWGSTALHALFQLVQVENPRIRKLCIEKLSNTSSDLISQRAGRMLMDFFNYSLPTAGMTTLCLHGVGLRDEQLTTICTGLEVTSNLTSLTLSLNLLGDDAMEALLLAEQKNKRRPLKLLDLSNNLMRLGPQVKIMLDAFRLPANAKHTLILDLSFNRILERFDGVESALEQSLSYPQIKVIYRDESFVDEIAAKLHSPHTHTVMEYTVDPKKEELNKKSKLKLPPPIQTLLPSPLMALSRQYHGNSKTNRYHHKLGHKRQQSGDDSSSPRGNHKGREPVIAAVRDDELTPIRERKRLHRQASMANSSKW